MIKKLILITIFCTFIFSCGKKTDLEYKANKSSVLIFKI